MSHSSRRRSRCVEADESIVRLWILRLLVPLGMYREALGAHGLCDSRLALALGMRHWLESDYEADPRRELMELRRLHQQAERAHGSAAPPQLLRDNANRLATLVGLNATECRLLEFTVMLGMERVLEDTADLLGNLSSAKAFHALSVVLHLPEADIRTALSAQGALARSGLLVLDKSSQRLRYKLNLLSDGFADTMVSTQAHAGDLLRGMVAPVTPGHLQLADYAHVQDSLNILLPYLRRALAQGRRGVNIFLHGAPGTGKSQLARVLAQVLGCEPFEIASEDEDGDPIDGHRRLRAFRAAQSFFAQRKALLVFDEAQDVFDDGDGLRGKSTAQLRKAWINRMLEENPVPALWLSNAIDGLDPAFVRRFDMVLELPVPPKKQRERILREHCADLLDARQIERLAQAEALAPAVVTRASAIVRLVRDELGCQPPAAALQHLISSTLQAQGHRPLAPLAAHGPDAPPEIYDPAFIHADADLAAIASGLQTARSARLCLYGPPGSGKTAYGRWVAEQLGAPLMVKRASDLASMWVGECEKNIARAFGQAQAEGAVLMIDEVDSFLQDRRSAQRSWEVSQVNEMLTQMEAFEGLFIASTNLMQGLDPASLRRFDLKVRFDFLRPEQALALLERYCKILQFTPPEKDVAMRLARLRQLTPGDFAAVMRQHRFRPMASAAALVSALQAECALKEGARQAVGFI
ncbi:ATP-binding protein [Vandammella animalimorsus]|nr:ATP-binding protein [Vandammella animalimorsus]